MDKSPLDLFTLRGAAEVMQGLPVGSPQLVLGERILDSRQCREGSLFIALAGENTDGHRFVEKALENGAAAALVNRDFWSEQGDDLRRQFPDGGFLVVDDTLGALQAWATEYRRLFLSDTMRIGVTGSSGKTTVKEMLGAILRHHRPTAMNPGNLNSDIGLPLTVLNIPPGIDFAVLEMGINRIGEMDELVEIFQPQMGVVTHIGTAHIGLLGSREGIAREKRKMFRYLTPRGGAVIWEEDSYRNLLTADLSVPILPYGEGSSFFEGAREEGFKGWTMTLEGRPMVLPLMGRHNLINALGAVTAARRLGASWEAVEAGLAEQRPLFGRGEVIEGDITLVVDCYNANPESFRKGIETLRNLPWPGRRILIAGAMGELGEGSEEAHKRLGVEIAAESLDAVFYFGTASRAAYESSGQEGRPVFWTDDYEELEKMVTDFARKGDLFYLKGSRLMELERLVEPLRSLHV